MAASRASRASAELEDVGAAAAAFAAAAGGAGEHGAGGGRSGWLRAMAAASEGVVWFLGSVVPRLPLRVTVRGSAWGWRSAGGGMGGRPSASRAPPNAWEHPLSCLLSRYTYFHIARTRFYVS